MPRYLTDEGAVALRHYKYAGSDRSLVYKYILTPMNAWLIQFFPLWMAPNGARSWPVVRVADCD